MKKTQSMVWTLAALAFVLPLSLAAQQLERDVSAVSDVEGQLEGFSFQEGPVSTLEFHGTAIALAAEGDARVEFQEGRARVDVTVRKLPDPWKFGPFSTYVLWAVTADGRANNVGSLEVREGRGSLRATTSLSQFALIVSAEPHFAVTAPSKYLVLRNLGRSIRGKSVMIAGLTERIDYTGLEAQPYDPGSRIPLDLVQARYALDIARGAQADKFAHDQFAQAAQLLAKAEVAQTDKKYKVRETVPLLARDAVQMGEDARRQALLGRQAADVAATAAEEAARREAAALAARREAEEKAGLAASIALEEARLRETERGIVAEIAGVLFATGAATLNPNAREVLARFSGIVGVYPSLRFRVEGHTDSTGSYETNQALSLQRALTVRD